MTRTTAAIRTPRARSFASLLERACEQGLPADEILQATVDAAARVMNTEVSTLYVYDQRARELVLAATRGLPRSAVGFVTLHLGEGISGRAAAEGSPIAVADVRGDPSFKVIPGFDQSHYRSILAVPVCAGEALIGALNVQTVAERRYAERDGQDLASIAAVLAPVLETLLAGDLSLRLRGPSVLSELDGIVAAALGPFEVLERLVARLRLLFPGVRCTALLVEDDGGRALVGDDLTPAELASAECCISSGAALSPGDERGPLLLLPIGAAERLFGALLIHADAPGRRPSFGTYEVEYVQTLVTQTEIVLSRLAAAAESRPGVPGTPGSAATAERAERLDALSQMVLDDAGLDALVVEAAEICGTPIAIVDASGTVIAGESLDNPRVSVDLNAGKSFLGRVVADTPEGRPLLAAVARILALELAKWKVRFDVESRLRGDVLDLLLQGRWDDERQVVTRAGLAGLDLTRGYVPALFLFDVGALSESRGVLALRAFERELHRACGEPPVAVTFVRPDGILLFSDPLARRGPLLPALNQAYDALRRLAGDLPTGVGVGPLCTHLGEYSRAYRQTKMAADLAVRMSLVRPLEANRLGAFRLLLALDDETPLRAFVADTLGPLLGQEGDLYGSELVRTLEAYHAAGERLRQAADALFIHANTLKYRLSRIEALTGRSLDNPADRLDLYLALYALRLLKPNNRSLLPNNIAG